MATDIKQENFDTFISQSDKPVLVDFWATWCGPCRMLSPVVEEVSREHENELTVGKVNVDDCPELAQKFGVMSIPTLVVVKDGKVADVNVGYCTKEKILELLDL